MAEFVKSDELQLLAEAVVKKYANFNHLADGGCRIAFQYADNAKTSSGKIVYADTERVKEKYKAFMPYDFVITFYKGNTAGLTVEQMEHLMYHELKHVGYEPDERKFFIVPHDLEDFKDVVNKWGVDWIRSEE